MFEHSVRAPLVAVGPEFPAGKSVDTPVYLQDVMPTSLELAGMDVPEEIQFRSLLPLVRGERLEQYEAIYGCYMDHQRMVLDDGYKLILYPNVPQVLLFDLQHDPYEKEDLSDDPSHRRRMRELFQKLKKLQQETGDSLDLTATFPELAMP